MSRSFWKIVVSYDGTNFHGWQVQPGQPTVQGTLATVLKKLTGETVLPQGSGRTDAGVHALGQVASFSLRAPLPPENLLRAMNRLLPGSVRVLRAERVGEEFHARHDALGKTYEYRIFERKLPPSAERICSPFLTPFVWDCRWALDAASMAQAAEELLGTHNFASFAATDPELRAREEQDKDGEEGTSGPNPVKTIDHSSVFRQDGLLLYRVTGSGFLHHMVRNIVGTLVEIGRGAMEGEQLAKILEARNRTLAGPTAPARGLFLVNVDYVGSTHRFGGETALSYGNSPEHPNATSISGDRP